MKVLISVIILLISINQSDQSRRLPDWHIRIAQQQGPNTCVVEEVSELNRRLWTECKYWYRQDVCDYQPVLKYECCEGYTRTSEQFGCPEEKGLKNLFQTVQDLGATDFIEYSVETEIEFDLTQSQSALTVFVPTNEAFKKLRGIPKRIFEADIRSALLHHIIQGRIGTNDTNNDESLITLMDGQTLRMNRYPNNIYYVNCIPIIRKDQLATNGIIHLIDDVLIPSKSWPLKSVLDSLIEDNRFREFSRLLIETDFIRKFEEIHGKSGYTVFVPNDEAFHKLPAGYHYRITSDPKVTELILKHHIIPHTICPNALTSKHNMKTWGGETVLFTCNRTGRYINGGKLTGESMNAENAIINVIDDILIPDSVKNLYELIEREERLSSFKQTVDKCPDVVLILQNSDQSLTLFAPNNNAFERLTSHQIGNLLDNCKLFIESHLIPYKMSTKSFVDNKIIDTLAPNRVINCRVTRKGLGIDSAFIEDSETEGQNGVLYIIDETLILP